MHHEIPTRREHWAQRYAVTTFCRILHTIESGRVTTKKAALLWARGSLDPGWSGLIQQVLDDRSLGWNAGEPARPGSVKQTLAFADYAKARAAEAPGNRLRCHQRTGRVRAGGVTAAERPAGIPSAGPKAVRYEGGDLRRRGPDDPGAA